MMTVIPNFPQRYIYQGNQFSGGQGDVYICTDQNLGRLVAIKVLQNVTNLATLHQEIHSLSRIQSKHVVELYDFFNNSIIGIVEEYVSGNDLTHYSETQPNLDEYLKTLYQIACGIADIHSCNMIHRDIKPNNIKFNEEGILKIFDFGIASAASPKPQTMAARGTMGYRAPELYGHSPMDFTKAVDVYAFGATAWCLAKGRLPSELLDNPPQSYRAVPSFGVLDIGLPNDVVQTLDATLQTNPYLRPKMTEVREILARRLLFGKHRAILTHVNQTYEISQQNSRAKIAYALGSLVIKYDNLFFTVAKFSGDVYVNNQPVVIGKKLPESCVITIGSPSYGANRLFLTFDVSHPEVVL
jgi:serine/threonine-protein kinase